MLSDGQCRFDCELTVPLNESTLADDQGPGILSEITLKSPGEFRLGTFWNPNIGANGMMCRTQVNQLVCMFHPVSILVSVLQILWMIWPNIVEHVHEYGCGSKP